MAPPADQARVRPGFLHERDGVIESPGKRQHEGTGRKEERLPGAMKGLRGWRSVLHALGAAEPASPPGSRSGVGPHCSRRVQGPGTRTRGVGRPGEREARMPARGEPDQKRVGRLTWGVRG